MTSSNYPTAFDNDVNLHLVHDGLRLQLAEDYQPGDDSITVKGDATTFANWPATGILTLTEQCSEIETRAISFSYSAIDIETGVISGLVIEPEFVDGVKAKNITNVTINVTAKHHNNLKDALIATQTFIGRKGVIDTLPFGDTMEGRINFLRSIALVPKAWFSVDKRLGIVPLTVTFVNKSFRLGTDGNNGEINVTWDFGDDTTRSYTTVGPDTTVVTKTYTAAGIYDVTLTVSNDFGTDSCVFPQLITGRIAAPNEAVIKFEEGTGQRVTEGDPENGPYTTFPKIRSPINTLISIVIESGENAATPDFSYAGEPLSSGEPLDPITAYNWELGDDLLHPNSPNTNAAYSVGGLYDLRLRVDTEFGAYRITNYPESIDVIENVNLWSWIFTNSTTVRGYEFGLLSETYKLVTNQSLVIDRNDSFLDSVAESTRQKREFKRNTNFAPRTVSSSGQRGSVLLSWASGRYASDPISSEKINSVEYNGFRDAYTSQAQITRPWNWACLNSTSTSYFVFGTSTTTPSSNTSPTNPTKTSLNLTSMVTTNATLTADSFSNNAQELLQNPAIYSSGTSVYGDFSVYRTTWKDSTGYIARNDGVGPLFRIKSFYRTVGTSGTPFQTISKLQDIQGGVKVEGQLTNLTGGIYFFNNSGSISRFSDTANAWATTGPGLNSVAYRAIQDTGVTGYDNASNTFLIASDGDHRSYMSFDYSANAFIKFNEIETTFTSVGSRPVGEQFIMGVY